MIRSNVYELEKIRLLTLLLAIVASGSAAVPALAQSSGIWEKTGNMKTARDAIPATLLQSGEVLVAGGDGSNGLLTAAELYNPANGQWTATGSLHTAGGGALTLLQNGQVLVTGADAELYNPSTGTWTVTGSMSTARYNYTQTLLPNGKVLMAGGINRNCVIPPCQVSSAEQYDPSTGTWSPTGNMTNARWGHTATLLANGLVLVTGGYGTTNVLSSAELYNAATGQWTTSGSMNTARADHYAELLSSGRVLVLLGDGGVTSTELYDPATGKWTINGNTGATAQFSFSVTLLNTGKVLIAGGADCFYPRPCTEVSTAELYDPFVGASTLTGSMNIARSGHLAILLTNGHVLAAGGMVRKANGTFDFTNTAELYVP